MEATKTVNDEIRKVYKPTYSERSKYQKMLEGTPAKELYSRFCTLTSVMNSTERKEFISSLNAKIDSFLMINNIRTLLRSEIPEVKNISKGCSKSFKGTGIIIGEMMDEWLKLVAPLAFRETQRLKCMKRSENCCK